jgi:hypothetical protein
MTDKQMCKQVSNYIKEHGWCQGQYQADSGEVCLVGACINLGDYDCDDTSATYRFSVRKALTYAGLAPQVITFNDKTGRTKEEVLAVLDNFANSPD